MELKRGAWLKGSGHDLSCTYYEAERRYDEIQEERDSRMVRIRKIDLDIRALKLAKEIMAAKN